jgi:glutamyl-tRNA synthetase
VVTGRFAPSPSAPLHVGSLRTALLAWAFARHAGGRFLLRVEDLTTGRVDPRTRLVADGQLADLAVIGVTHDGPVVRQSGRRDLHEAALRRLVDAGLTYPCYCTRREIAEAASAPHDRPERIAYPGTCRDLTAEERAARERAGRRPALRLRADGEVVEAVDLLHGPVRAAVDDVVLRRADGLVAYHLAVVVDDGDQGVDQVVRGDDLLAHTPVQVLLQRLLGLPTPAYVHVPLVLSPDGRRLAKRDGAVTLAERLAAGDTVGSLVGRLGCSLGLAAPGEELTARELLERFDPARVPHEPWVWRD